MSSMPRYVEVPRSMTTSFSATKVDALLREVEEVRALQPFSPLLTRSMLRQMAEGADFMAAEHDSHWRGRGVEMACSEDVL